MSEVCIKKVEGTGSESVYVYLNNIIWIFLKM